MWVAVPLAILAWPVDLAIVVVAWVLVPGDSLEHLPDLFDL